MRRRILAMFLTVFTLAVLAGPVGATGEDEDISVDTGDGTAYVCVNSRLLPRGVCVYYYPTI